MKKSVYLVLLCLCFSAHANVSQMDQQVACEAVKKLIPTEAGHYNFDHNGYGISTTLCLEIFEFEYYEGEEDSSERTIQMWGATVEDLATICTVEMNKNVVKKAYCELG